MAVLTPTHFLRWELTEDDNTRAAILSTEQLQKFETMNVELAESLAEFTFQAGGDSGVLLNSVDFWQLRGRRGLVLELLQAHDDAIGEANAPLNEDESSSDRPTQPTF